MDTSSYFWFDDDIYLHVYIGMMYEVNQLLNR